MLVAVFPQKVAVRNPPLLGQKKAFHFSTFLEFYIMIDGFTRQFWNTIFSFTSWVSVSFLLYALDGIGRVKKMTARMPPLDQISGIKNG